MNQQYLKTILRYDPKDGVFYWIRPSKRAKAGSIAGTISTKYYVIRIDGKSYSAHRIAWLYMTGSWPKDQLDHIDRDKLNNRWDNLRACTASENQRNKNKYKNNTSGYRGVWLHKPSGKWLASIRTNGKKTSLGSHSSPEEAYAKYVEASIRLHGEFSSI